ncbi:MAG: hypothetical protein QGF78_07230 [Candidatus Bathyarchaeota archaeon]|nr:hypothetical protein [Candidatus Bathyarchaeota archaeon]
MAAREPMAIPGVKQMEPYLISRWKGQFTPDFEIGELYGPSVPLMGLTDSSAAVLLLGKSHVIGGNSYLSNICMMGHSSPFSRTPI